MDENQSTFSLILTEFGERLGVVAARLERILAAQQELLELHRDLARQLHPAESERRSRQLLDMYHRGLDVAHEKLEKRLMVRWLGVTSLFGFIVYLVERLAK